MPTRAAPLRTAGAMVSIALAQGTYPKIQETQGLETDIGMEERILNATV